MPPKVWWPSAAAEEATRLVRPWSQAEYAFVAYGTSGAAVDLMVLAATLTGRPVETVNEIAGVGKRLGQNRAQWFQRLSWRTEFAGWIGKTRIDR